MLKHSKIILLESLITWLNSLKTIWWTSIFPSLSMTLICCLRRPVDSEWTSVTSRNMELRASHPIAEVKHALIWRLSSLGMMLWTRATSSPLSWSIKLVIFTSVLNATRNSEKKSHQESRDSYPRNHFVCASGHATGYVKFHLLFAVAVLTARIDAYSNFGGILSSISV